MKDMQFRVLLDLMMVSDPWPLDDDARSVLVEQLHNESRKRGYDDMVTAYHSFLGKHTLTKGSITVQSVVNGKQQVKVVSPKATAQRKPRKVRGIKKTK